MTRSPEIEGALKLGMVPDVLEELKTIFHIDRNGAGRQGRIYVSLFGLGQRKISRRSARHGHLSGRSMTISVTMFHSHLRMKNCDNLWE